MRFNILIYFIVLLCSQIRSFGQDEELNNTPSMEANTFLSSQFLAGALQSTKIEDEDSLRT